MFTGVSQAICAQAWAICEPSVARAAEALVTNKRAGTIIVLDPWDDEVLFQARVHNEHPSAEKYDEIALAKAHVSKVTGLPSREVQQRAPHLYLPRMTKWGGAVIQDKLVVAFSGVQPVFDEAIASSMLRWIIAICQNEMTNPGGVMEAESSYIGE